MGYYVGREVVVVRDTCVPVYAPYLGTQARGMEPEKLEMQGLEHKARSSSLRRDRLC